MITSSSTSALRKRCKRIAHAALWGRVRWPHDRLIEEQGEERHIGREGRKRKEQERTSRIKGASEESPPTPAAARD